MRRNAPLRLVYAMDMSKYTARRQDLPPVQDHRDMSWSVLTSAIVVDVEDVDIEVEPVLEVGRPVDVLLEHARQAQLVVVGSRGRSELVELLLGSTSLQLAMHSPCPVVVIRPAQPGTAPSPSAGRVVVGVDGSELSDAAVRFAFEEADRRSVGLTAVHVWLAPSYAIDATPPRAWDVAAAEERAILAERVAGLGSEVSRPRRRLPHRSRRSRERPGRALHRCGAHRRRFTLRQRSPGAPPRLGQSRRPASRGFSSRCGAIRGLGVTRNMRQVARPRGQVRHTGTTVATGTAARAPASDRTQEAWHDRGSREPDQDFLLDDHEVVRRGVRDLLEVEDDLEVVGEAGSAGEALVMIPATRPDVAVLDVRLPDGDGVSVCRESDPACRTWRA